MNYEQIASYVGVWNTVILFVFFTVVVLWVFRPGKKNRYRDDAEIPFRHENKPIVDEEKR